VELHNAGYQVELSFRGQLKFGPSPALEALLSPLTSVVEKISLILEVKKDSFPPMAGGKSRGLIGSGQIVTRPDIARFHEREVEFVDGQRQAYDLVLFATGYRPDVRHLETLTEGQPVGLSELESSQVPGLFFLGLDNERTYRSRFLRGIRRDAQVVAAQVMAALVALPHGFCPRGTSNPIEVDIDLDRAPELVLSNANP
jgi:hypothetical protein